MRTESENSTVLSRRQFGTGAGVAALAAGTPGVAMAAGSTRIAEITESSVSLTTANGTVSGHFVHPAKGAHPAVLSWRGATGLDVINRNEARDLARQGYSVLVLDRDGADAGPIEGDAVGAVEWLEAQAQVDGDRGIGTAEWAKQRLEPTLRY